MALPGTCRNHPGGVVWTVIPSSVPPTSRATAARSADVLVDRKETINRSLVEPRPSPHAAASTLSTGGGAGWTAPAFETLSGLAALCPTLSDAPALGPPLSDLTGAAESGSVPASTCAAQGRTQIPESASAAAAICLIRYR